MTVIRDPETGQFMQAEEAAFEGDMDVFVGELRTTIPSSDLTTGEDVQEVDGDESELIDFTDFLEADEVFILHAVMLLVEHQPGRTATAEMVDVVEWVLSRDSALEPQQAGTAINHETGIADIRQDEIQDSSIILRGSTTGSGDIADSTNGLGAGPDYGAQDFLVNYPAMGLPGPGFDEDDELYIPHRWIVKGSDDQRARAVFNCTVYGRTIEL